METTVTTPVPPPVDTSSLSTSVRHYLKSNQNQLSRFSSLVLGVTQPYLSTLLSKHKPWHLLSRRVQALYQRMQLWMDTRATYGSNPYYREKRQTDGQTKGKRGRPKSKKGDSSKKPRSLFDMENNMKLLKRFEDLAAAQGLVEESGIGQLEDGAMVEVFGGGESGQAQELVGDRDTVGDGVLTEVIEDGELNLDRDGKYEEHMEGAVGDNGNQQKEVFLVTSSQEGIEEQDAFTYQMEGENQTDIPVFLVVEDILDRDQPGTYTLTFLQDAGDLAVEGKRGLTG